MTSNLMPLAEYLASANGQVYLIYLFITLMKNQRIINQYKMLKCINLSQFLTPDNARVSVIFQSIMVFFINIDLLM